MALQTDNALGDQSGSVFAPEEGVRRRTTWSDLLNAALLLVLLLWPHSISDRQLSITMLLAVSTIAILNRPFILPRVSIPLLVFFSYFAAVLALQALGGGLNRYALSQANHLVQLPIYYYAFSKILQGCNWSGIISSPFFLVAAALASTVYGGYLLDVGANQSDVSITLIAWMLGLFIRGGERQPVTHFLAVLGVAIAILAITDRSSVVLILLTIPAMYLLSVPRHVLRLGVLVILLAPILFYLVLSYHDLLRLYQLDHNTGIRADFIRGGASLLGQSPLFGIGFGEPYRPTGFSYGEEHQLLNEVESVHIVPNHHSLFDVALRLGIPAAALFWWGVFNTAPSAVDRRVYPLLAVVAAVELSFNAWLENQYMLPQLTIIVAMMHAGLIDGRTGRRMNAPLA